MEVKRLKELLDKVSNKKITLGDAVEKLKFLPFEDLGFAKIDHHRALRKGFPEVVFCQNKTVGQVVGIMKKLALMNSTVIGTRATLQMYRAVKKEINGAQYNKNSGTIIIKNKTGKEIRNKIINKKMPKEKSGYILILSAGTSDIRVAEEAACVAEAMDNKVERLYDVGVAGIHRLLANKEKLMNANVLIVVAGMDGVLPGVTAGLSSAPIIAVPTSVGYGASFGGIAPLLTMLNSCSPGVVVVNIDNGFGAGYFASMINKRD